MARTRGKGKDGDGAAAAGPDGFEQSLKRLEAIVAELEGSDVPLERALALFEEGVGLGRACTARLDAAERRIAILLEQADGSLVEKPFDPAMDVGDSPRHGSVAARNDQAPRKAPARDEDDDDGRIPF